MLNRADIRVIWESNLVPPPPVIVRSDIPQDLEAELRSLFVNLHQEDMTLAESVAKGKTQGFVPVDHSTYQSTVEMRKALAVLRKQN
jgi:phosphonate transport system substrate-binding protein